METQQGDNPITVSRPTGRDKFWGSKRIMYVLFGLGALLVAGGGWVLRVGIPGQQSQRPSRGPRWDLPDLNASSGQMTPLERDWQFNGLMHLLESKRSDPMARRFAEAFMRDSALATDWERFKRHRDPQQFGSDVSRSARAESLIARLMGSGSESFRKVARELLNNPLAKGFLEGIKGSTLAQLLLPVVDNAGQAGQDRMSMVQASDDGQASGPFRDRVSRLTSNEANALAGRLANGAGFQAACASAGMNQQCGELVASCEADRSCSDGAPAIASARNSSATLRTEGPSLGAANAIAQSSTATAHNVTPLAALSDVGVARAADGSLLDEASRLSPATAEAIGAHCAGRPGGCSEQELRELAAGLPPRDGAALERMLTQRRGSLFPNPSGGLSGLEAGDGTPVPGSLATIETAVKDHAADQFWQAVIEPSGPPSPPPPPPPPPQPPPPPPPPETKPPPPETKPSK